MKQKIAGAIILILTLSGTLAFCEERIVIRDITQTQMGVVKLKEYYGDTNLLLMQEWLKPKDVLNGKISSDTLVVQSRNRYFYNQDNKKVTEISELSDGTVLHTTITEYNSKGEIIAERSFDNRGHNHFARLYKNGEVVKVIEEEGKSANTPSQPTLVPRAAGR